MAPLSLAALGAALLACTATSGSAAVVYLVGCFGLAALRLLAGGAGFLGFAYLLVYVGAIAILALFAVMLTEAGAPRARPRGLSVPATGLGAAALLGGPAGGLGIGTAVLPVAPVHLGAQAAPLFGELAPLTGAAAGLLLLAMWGSVALAR